MPNGLKTALLLGLLSGLLLVIGQLLGGANGMLIGFIFAVVMNFGSYWFSDKIVLRMYQAQEVGAGHRLYSTVERLSRQAGCRCRRSTSFRIRRRTRSRPAGTPRMPPSRRPRAFSRSSATRSSKASSRTSSRTSSTATSSSARSPRRSPRRSCSRPTRRGGP